MSPPRGGLHRESGRTSWYSWLGLLAALAAAGTLLILPAPGTAAAAPKPSSAALMLADGTAFSPLIYIDAQTALGTAPRKEGGAVRLLLRTGESVPAELRRVASELNPQWTAATVTGDDVVWAEFTVNAQGRGVTQLWRGSWRTPTAAPVLLTADTGDIEFFNSQYDLVVTGGRVYWAAAANSAVVTTEVRSVPLNGGPVAVRPVPGIWALSAWPWLISTSSGPTAPVELLNLDSGRQVRVATSATELVSCSPVWCRALVLAKDGPARLDLMHPDGSDRQRAAGGRASAAVQDVGLLDRFEVVSQSGGAGSVTSSQQLLLYDTKRHTLVPIAGGVGVVQARGPILWWSTGDNDALRWHALDLRTLR